MNIGNKLCVPSLQRICLNFLLTHAAGRPIKAMRIAELFEEEELYREASRFVLDNPGGWPEQELNTLSSETLLKLEKRYVCILSLNWDEPAAQSLTQLLPDGRGSSNACSNSASCRSPKNTNVYVTLRFFLPSGD